MERKLLEDRQKDLASSWTVFYDHFRRVGLCWIRTGCRRPHTPYCIACVCVCLRVLVCLKCEERGHEEDVEGTEAEKRETEVQYPTSSFRTVSLQPSSDSMTT